MAILKIARMGHPVLSRVAAPVKDPTAPEEVGYFIPEPAPGRVAPQSNDVDVDERGLIYLVDRYSGFDVLEFRKP